MANNVYRSEPDRLAKLLYKSNYPGVNPIIEGVCSEMKNGLSSQGIFDQINLAYFKAVEECVPTININKGQGSV